MWEGTDELKFSRKTYTDFSNKVWQDQSRFKGLAKDFRFDATLVGCASYEEMVLDTAEKICNNCGNERKKALCKEMELILSKRRREFERFGSNDSGHERIIKLGLIWLSSGLAGTKLNLEYLAIGEVIISKK